MASSKQCVLLTWTQFCFINTNKKYTKIPRTNWILQAVSNASYWPGFLFLFSENCGQTNICVTNHKNVVQEWFWAGEQELAQRVCLELKIRIWKGSTNFVQKASSRILFDTDYITYWPCPELSFPEHRAWNRVLCSFFPFFLPRDFFISIPFYNWNKSNSYGALTVIPTIHFGSSFGSYLSVVRMVSLSSQNLCFCLSVRALDL